MSYSGAAPGGTTTVHDFSEVDTLRSFEEEPYKRRKSEIFKENPKKEVPEVLGPTGRPMLTAMIGGWKLRGLRRRGRAA